MVPFQYQFVGLIYYALLN